MSLAGVKPSDGLGDGDLAAGGEAGEEAGDVAEEAVAGSWDPMEIIMSTTPDLAASDVQERTGLDLWAAHLVIMVRKMLSAVVPSAGDDSGLPAIGNGLFAAYYRFLSPSTDEDDDAESEASFRDDGDVPLEERDDYRDPAAGGAPA